MIGRHNLVMNSFCTFSEIINGKKIDPTKNARFLGMLEE